jgi:hypothetical protein
MEALIARFLWVLPLVVNILIEIQLNVLLLQITAKTLGVQAVFVLLGIRALVPPVIILAVGCAVIARNIVDYGILMILLKVSVVHIIVMRLQDVLLVIMILIAIEPAVIIVVGTNW